MAYPAAAVIGSSYPLLRKIQSVKGIYMYLCRLLGAFNYEVRWVQAPGRGPGWENSQCGIHKTTSYPIYVCSYFLIQICMETVFIKQKKMINKI